ncbi:SDR family oxidoreductase (plasmid) [Deinococcus radiomollis]|uniref:NAD(P)-dependent oxidoreductase n=1 Tax=Deinococcus radiomollis TaxID=468916 RepID=UPI003891B268
MTKLIVFGASGGTGQRLVEQALEKEYEVTAFVRQASSFPAPHPRLRLVVGDVRNPQDVSAACAEQDAVLSALGPSAKSEPICEDGTRAILAGMQAHGVKRLVALSAYGAAESHHGLYSWVTWAMLKTKMQDKERMETLIRDSLTDWTLVRPPALTNGAHTGTYQTGLDVPISLASNISRADVADFMLREAQACRFLRETPTITGRRRPGTPP